MSYLKHTLVLKPLYTIELWGMFRSPLPYLIFSTGSGLGVCGHCKKSILRLDL
jgi:hypothetical protein